MNDKAKIFFSEKNDYVKKHDIHINYLYALCINNFMKSLRNYIHNLCNNMHVQSKIHQEIYRGIVYLANEGCYIRNHI